ncbi:ADP-ribosylation factor-like protein 10 isoform X2 [Equus quagga]|uniref:ADP-ribosylation factor-like protein 10 isoform X2 n=1 Tax=Equus quagga TaxID=89248 RepID=UPI001EE1DA04|nr:ADP-ribosylation factor-like protein 10 isoform X2 [Equus quagga]
MPTPRPPVLPRHSLQLPTAPCRGAGRSLRFGWCPLSRRQGAGGLSRQRRCIVGLVVRSALGWVAGWARPRHSLRGHLRWTGWLGLCSLHPRPAPGPMAPRPLSPLVLALGGAAAVLGSVLFILWKAYFGRGSERRWDRGEAWWGAEPARLPEWDEWDPEDEEDEEPALEELEQREVLVLGLDGSGKSTFLRVLSGKPPLEGHIPTWGFNSVRLPTKDFEVDLLEIGGSQNLRFYWKEFVNEVDVLVFMVDSADRLRLPWARQELHKLLDKDPDLPVVVVANKQK